LKLHYSFVYTLYFSSTQLPVQVPGQPDVYCEYSTTLTIVIELKGEFCCIWRSLSSQTLL